ncbi:hypothetical protein [Streptomyces dysideae]|uniref:Uncharacterized protein n=1 Tax=Streptomyces dysideae TaxID=909626 RepID=A0A101UTW1_9ACTN|nr:hypothetical protein [Streptomyces dysideae]KUO16771.1 hypothetical protein AQJ91_33930 [Streptomyces dysideae]
MPATDPIAPQTSTVYAPATVCRPLTAAADDGTVSLDARARQYARSLPGPFRYELKGVTFALPSPYTLSLTQWRRFHDGSDALAAFQAVLGEPKAREMTAAGFTLGDLAVIVAEWEHRSGVRR